MKQLKTENLELKESITAVRNENEFLVAQNQELRDRLLVYEPEPEVPAVDPNAPPADDQTPPPPADPDIFT